MVVTRAGYDVARIIYDTDILYRLRSHIHIVTEWIPNEISATAVRRALMRGESVKYLLQDSVIDYIRENSLYMHPSTEDVNSNHTETEDGQETAV